MPDKNKHKTKHKEHNISNVDKEELNAIVDDLLKNVSTEPNPTKPGDLIQQNTLEGLASLSTAYIPKMTVKELIELTGDHGVGLGTLMNEKGVLLGEVTVIDGKAYVSEKTFGKRGNTREAKPDEMVFFAQVGYFESSELKSYTLNKDSEFVKDHGGKITKEVLEEYIRTQVLNNDPEKTGAFVVKITNASFDKLTLRSVDGSREYQFEDGIHKPKNLSEVIEQQTQISFNDPSKKYRLAGIYNNVDEGRVSTSESFEGLHLHAVDKQRHFGGHVQVKEMEMNSCIIQVMPVERWLVTTKEHAEEIGFKTAEHPATEMELKLAREKAKQFNSSGYGLSH